MKKMQKTGIVMLSAVVLGGVAPAVAPSVLNLNGGVVYAAEETHKVTIHYDLYDDPMFLLRSSSSSSKVVDVTPNQPLSDHIPETFPGGYVFAAAGANSGGSEGELLSSRNDLFGNWTNIYVGYNLKLKKSRTNPSNAGTNNNEKPHKVTIFYCPYDGIPREPTKKVVDVTPNQPLSDHIPETLPGGYVFADAIANGGGSEGGVSLSSRNDLFGNETAFYVHYYSKKNNNPGKKIKLLNGSVVPDGENVVSVAYDFDGMDYATRVNVNIAENPNATVGDYYPLTKDGGVLKYITDGKTMLWVYNPRLGVDLRGDLLSKHSHLLGTYTQPMLGEYTQPNNAGTTPGTTTPGEKPDTTPGTTTPGEKPGTTPDTTTSGEKPDTTPGTATPGEKPSTTPDTVTPRTTYLYVTSKEDKTLPNSVVESWSKKDGHWFYQLEDGSYIVNEWKQINGAWYRFDNSGVMQTGWIKENGIWYYLNDSGAMQTGWVKENGIWYYLNQSGAMETGWFTVSGKWYYANELGALATNTITPDGYTVNADGEWVE